MIGHGTEQAWDEYIESAYKLGYTRETLREFLIQSGYEAELVDHILTGYKSREERDRRNALGASAFIMLLGAALVILSMQPTLLGMVTYEAADATINLAVEERTVPKDFYGSVTGGITGNQSRIDTTRDGIPDTASDYQLHRRKILEAGITQIRMDMDITNVYNRDGTFNRWNSCNTCNFDNHKSTVQWARENNITIRVVAAYMPTWLANVTPACSSSPTRCEPNNYTIWQQAVVRYIDEVGCDEPGTNCIIEAWNEPYLGQFLLPGGTCMDRTRAYFRLYDATRAAVKARWPNMIVGGPVGFSSTACSKLLTDSFMGNYTQSQVDEFILHQYSSSGNNDLAAKLRSDIQWVRNANHKQPLCFTEYNVNNDVVSLSDPTRHRLYLTEAMMEGLRADNVTCLVLFEWTSTTHYRPDMGYPYPANYIMFSEPRLDNQERASFTASRDFTRQHPGGTRVIRTTANTNNIAVFMTKGSNGNRITVANRAATAKSFTLAFTDLGSGTLRDVLTNATVPVIGGVGTLPALAGYGIGYYEYTPTAAPPPPPTLPPALSGAVIAGNAATVLAGSTVTCSVTGIATQGLTGTVTVTWSVNGTNLTPSTRSVSTATGTTISESFSSPRAAAVSEAWRCSARLTTTTGTATATSAQTVAVAAPDVTNPWVQGITPTSQSNTSNTSVLFSWRTTDETSTSLSCAIVVNDITRATVTAANNSNTSTIVSLPIGSYDWLARCADGAGNTGLSARREFRVVAQTTVPPSQPNQTNSTNQTNQTIPSSPSNQTVTPPSNQTNNQTTNQTNNQSGNQTGNQTITVPVIRPNPPSAVLSLSGGTKRDEQLTWSLSASSSEELRSIVLTRVTSYGRTELYRNSYDGGVESATIGVPDTVTVGVGGQTCATLSVTDTGNQTTNATRCFTSTNSAPRLAVPMLEGYSGELYPGESITCTVTAEDLDETTLQVRIALLQNGTVWNSSNRTMQSGDVLRETVPATAVFSTDTWSCNATVSDGVASDSQVSSDVTVPEPSITNPAPSGGSGRSTGGGGGGSSGGSGGSGRTVAGSATLPPPRPSSPPQTTSQGQASQPDLFTGVETPTGTGGADDVTVIPTTELPSVESPEPIAINRTRQYTGFIGVFMFITGALGLVVTLRKHHRTAQVRPTA